MGIAGALFESSSPPKYPIYKDVDVICEIPYDQPFAEERNMVIYHHGGDALTFIRADGSRYTIYGLRCQATHKGA